MSTVDDTSRDDSKLDPETQGHLDDAWDALGEGDLEAAAQELAKARAGAPPRAVSRPELQMPVPLWA